MNTNLVSHLKSIPFKYNGTTFHIIGNTEQGYTGITYEHGKYESLEVTYQQNDEFLKHVKKALNTHSQTSAT